MLDTDVQGGKISFFGLSGWRLAWEDESKQWTISHERFIGSKQGGEGRVSEAENLRSPREIQSIFYLLGRTGKFIIFII